jgi:hypothetical protein
LNEFVAWINLFVPRVEILLWVLLSSDIPASDAVVRGGSPRKKLGVVFHEKSSGRFSMKKARGCST